MSTVHWRCYKWLSPTLPKPMRIKSLATAFLFTASLVIMTLPVEARTFYVRETQGTVKITGWQTGLVKRNPNLKRWHWNPITANYNHAKPIRPAKKPWKVNRVLRKGPYDMAARTPHYVRPNHASMPIARNSNGSASQNPRVTNPLVSHDINGQLRSRDVAARLQSQRTQGQLASRDVDASLSIPVVKANYKLANHEVAGYLAHKKTDIKLASHDLNGQLANRSVSGQLAQQSAAGQLAARSADGRLLSQNINGTVATKTVSADMLSPIARRYEFDYRGPAGGFDDTPTFPSGYQSVKSRVSAKIKRTGSGKF